MANSSDSSQAISSGSGSDSDRPLTPGLIAPRKRTNTGLSATAPSKIPKLKPTATNQSSLSPPRTPADRDTATATLDWGSGGEWSSLVRDVKHSTTEMDPKPVDDAALLVDAHPGGLSENADYAPVRLSIASSGLFNDSGQTTPDLERSHDSIQPKEVSDDDEPLIVLEEDDQQPREEFFQAGVVPQTESSDAAASLTSDSEHSDMLTTSDAEQTSDANQSDEASEDEELPTVTASSDIDQHTIEENDLNESATSETELSDTDGSRSFASEELPALSTLEDVVEHKPDQADLHETAMPEPELSDSDVSHSSASGRLPTLSIIKNVIEHKSEQTDLHETAMPESEFSDVDASVTSDSDVFITQPPTVRIRGPFLNIAMKDHAAGSSARVSPETVLRGLVRDAHPEMIHFTLPHSHFSPDDLRKGLQHAYGMLQVATSKSVILALLEDDTTDIGAGDLRRWIALVDHSNPKGRSETHMSVIFESLSIGEMRAALEELVQSRLVTEAEAERKRTLLVKRMMAKERQEKIANSLVEKVARCSRDVEGDSIKSQVSDDNETAFDALLTAVMVVLIGALYICNRE